MIQILKKHHWPGNIRELKNFVARAAAMFKDRSLAKQDLVALIDDLDPRILGDNYLKSFDLNNMTKKEAEKSLILRGLIMNKGNQRKTSIQLGIPKSTLSDKIKHYKINVCEIKQASKA